ncbi:alpha/beta hydrolase [Mycobacterium sp. BMJ-28]
MSAGVLTAGLSAGVLTGAAVAVADTESPATTSGTTGSPPSEQQSPPAGAGTPKTEAQGEKATEAVPPKKKKKKPAVRSATQSDTVHKSESSAESKLSAASETKSEPAKTASPATTPPAAKTAAPSTLRLATEPVTAKAAPTASNPIKVIAKAVTNLFNNVGSVAVNALQALEKLFTGPPVLPAKSTVTVRSSTILLSNGQRVQANWYYPEPDPDTGAPPTRMILLQHGFFALGPMYSYTAANLAERTNSVVVTPTLPSNWFAGDDHWLGGTGMAAQIADLFDGNREALTQSALAAGYATRYGLDPATAALPQKFALAGHSLGANLVSGAAGFLAENGAAKDLVGVILLDGVPTGSTLSDALGKLDTYQANGGQYVPIREIGAPPNLFNFISTVNQDLSTARPDRFNGVILSGGVHMDSMQGGNSLIQFAAYLVAGIPQAQNPPAVQDLTVAWLTAWFAGTDEGDVPAPGTIIDIDTPKGTAHGTVIGTAPVKASATVAA